VASEEGVVIRVDASGTWVKTIRSDACDSCSSKSSCHSLGGGKEMEVAAINPIGARVGDRVVLKMDSAAFLKGTFLIYMFPVLLLVAGAALGEWTSAAFDLHPPLPSILFGFGGLCVMVEGRCLLSSYCTGESPNSAGVCSPAKAVRWQETPAGLESRLNGVLLDRYRSNEKAGYPTLC